MKSLTLQRVDRPDTGVLDIPPSTYGMDLTVTTANDMPTKVFVKQRLTEDGTQDVFASVASAENLETLGEAPTSGSSYFLVDRVELVFVSAAARDQLYDDVVADLQLLIAELEALDTVASPSATVEITASTIVPL